MHDSNRSPLTTRALSLPRLALGLLAGAAALSLGGCSLLPQAQVDPTRFYILTSTPIAAPASTPAGQAPVVYLRPVELASYIKAKPIIVRRGNNEIEFREYARWGEPLELGISRVLREDLVGRGAARAMLGVGVRSTETEPDYTLVVRVLACEGAADGAVNFRAVWMLATFGTSPKEVARGEVSPTDLRWDGKSESALASQLSRAVAVLAEDIASGLLRSGK